MRKSRIKEAKEHPLLQLILVSLSVGLGLCVIIACAPGLVVVLKTLGWWAWP